MPIDTNEIQSVALAVASGSLTLTANGRTTAPIAFPASAATVQAALNATGVMGTSGVTVTETTPGGVPTYTVEFNGTATAERPFALITADLTEAIGLANGAPTIADNFASGFALTPSSGTWSAFSTPAAHGGSEQFAPAGSGSTQAAWTITGLPSGPALVYTNFRPQSNASTNTPFTAVSGGNTLGPVAVDQTAALVDLTVAGFNYKLLGSLTISSGQVVTTLTGTGTNSSEFLFAGAILIQPVLAPSATITRTQAGEPACIASAAVGGSGESVIITITDRTSNPVPVASITTDPTFTKNGTPVSSTTKYWGSTTPPYLPVIEYLFDEAFLSTDMIGVTVGSGWASGSVGTLGLVDAVSATAVNHVGGSTLGTLAEFAPAAGNPLKMGMNTAPWTNASNGRPTYANLARMVAPWFIGEGATTTWTTNEFGYIDTMVLGTGRPLAQITIFTETQDGLGLPNLPIGLYWIQWSGPLMALDGVHTAYEVQANDSSTVVSGFQASASGGMNVGSFTVEHGTGGSYSLLLDLFCGAPGTGNLTITRAGIDIGTLPATTTTLPCIFDPDYIALYQGIPEIRFMDAMNVNNGSCVDFSDMTTTSRLSYGALGAVPSNGGNFTSIAPYSANWTNGPRYTYVLLTFPSPHGFKADGQLLTVSAFDATALEDTHGNALSFSDQSVFPIKLVNSTQVAVPIPSAGFPLAQTYTPTGTWTAGCYSCFTNTPLDDQIDKANAILARFGTLETVNWAFPVTMSSTCLALCLARIDLRLDPRLTVAPVVGNELWNFGFYQTVYYEAIRQYTNGTSSRQQAYAKDNAALHALARTAFATSGRKLLCIYEVFAEVTDVAIDTLAWTQANAATVDRIDPALYFGLQPANIFETGMNSVIAAMTDAQLDDLHDAVLPYCQLNIAATHRAALASTPYAATPIGSYEAGMGGSIEVGASATTERQSHVGIFSPRAYLRTKYVMKQYELSGAVMMKWFEVCAGYENQTITQNGWPGWNLYESITMVPGLGTANLTPPSSTAPRNQLQSVMGQAIIDWAGAHQQSITLPAFQLYRRRRAG